MKCPRCRTEWIGTPTEDGRRKCRLCAAVWIVLPNGKAKFTWTPERGYLPRNTTQEVG